MIREADTAVRVPADAPTTEPTAETPARARHLTLVPDVAPAADPATHRTAPDPATHAPAPNPNPAAAGGDPRPGRTLIEGYCCDYLDGRRCKAWRLRWSDSYWTACWRCGSPWPPRSNGPDYPHPADPRPAR